jgi:glutathione peroxidase
MKDIYSFEAETLEGEKVTLDAFRGKVVLIVNTASKCGFTPQYDGLEKLYEQYKDEGLVILGFPCNQFAHQEPGGKESIEQTCRVRYGVTFPMFSKIDVNGKNAHPLYQYLKKEKPGFPGKRIKWNFTKFLVDPNGKPVKRFAPYFKPEKLGEYIEPLLNGK